MNEILGEAVRDERTGHETGGAGSGSALAVMYHYVREEYKGSGIFGVTAAQFETQLLRLKEQYEVMHPLAFLEWARGGRSLPPKACVLTFDDGLADHYHNVFPLLKKHGLHAFFFLTTGPLETGRIATIHKVHLLRQAMGEAQFERECRTRLTSQGLAAEAVSVQDSGMVYRWDSPGVGAFKFFISWVVPYQLMDAVVTRLFNEVLGSDREHMAGTYLSWEQAQELQAAGMVIGGHSHAHRMYSRLPPAEQEADITVCLSTIKRRLGQATMAYAYPFGQAATFTVATKDILRRQGIACAFANETGVIGHRGDIFALNRVDPKAPTL